MQAVLSATVTDSHCFDLLKYMRLIYSDEVKRLFDMVEPYLALTGITSHLKDDAPEEIKKAYEKWCELIEKEDHDALVAEGLI